MRNLFECKSGQAEVSVSSLRTAAKYSMVKSVLHLESREETREFLLTDSTAHEQCADGSLRRYRLLSGRNSLQEYNFLYLGKPCSVSAVGGLASRVEDYGEQGSVVAPMNGQVVKVFKKNGESVEAGEVVLIIEAMKMENEVSAPQAGKVCLLSVEPGRAVTPGQQLFSVEIED